jgi:hypothetical protein
VKAAGVVVDQEIELGAVSKHAEDDFGGEAGVAGIQYGGVGGQQIGGVGATLHAQENVEGEGAGGRDVQLPILARYDFDAEARRRGGRRGEKLGKKRTGVRLGFRLHGHDPGSRAEAEEATENNWGWRPEGFGSGPGVTRAPG